MKVSVITINLNDKVGLEKTILSVLNQTFTDYEFIVVDGASDDGSLDIIEQYKDKITYWISEEDKGIYNAMNKGIKQAKGEYLYFLNAGDRLASHDVLARFFSDSPADSFLCGNFISEKNGVLNKYEPYKNREWTFSLYDIYSGDLCHQAFFIRRDNFEKYGLYNEEMKITADWGLFFNAIGINNEKVAYRDIDVVIYNMEGLSSTIGGKVIYEERKQMAEALLSPYMFSKLDRLYTLEKNAYIIDIIQSRGSINNGFRAFCKLGRMLGFIKS